ncbi:MAG TPA: hypothetical protein VM240_06905, partial [Verrucomicrobiae bacterium]|nr:hypothetical protein [Verrucomicrobiae bacterium]
MRRGLVAGAVMVTLALAGLYGARVIADEAAVDAQARETPAESAPADAASPESFDFFSDQPIAQEQLVEVPQGPGPWMSIGGPIALIGFFFVQMFFYWWMVPFQMSKVDINLQDFPTGVKRGIAMALMLFGIAFCFGASEIWYQLKLHGTAEAYFEQMSLGKLIAFTHAHLFGFTTSFFIIGIPFSMQFNHLWQYQWIFPVGLAASLTDVVSWWGIKYGAPSFEWVSMFCGVVFSVSYLWMLIGLERVLLFP